MIKPAQEARGKAVVAMADEKRDLIAAIGKIQMHVVLPVENTNASADQVISGGSDPVGNRRIADDSLRESFNFLRTRSPLQWRLADNLLLMIVYSVGAR